MEGRQWSLFFILSLALASSHHGRAYDGSLKKRICNEVISSDFGCSVNAAMDAITKYTKLHPTYTYYYGGDCHKLWSPYIYGYGFCRKELSSNDCGDCIVAAKESLFQECNKQSVGAQVELQECGIRYENYKFMDYPH